ncbi:MAG: hypothetical protein UV68_C0072G0009 [Candidatus Collierbacteria bacterium GW2011_GWC2_43_12]|uniref:Uncharacterized protein n=1 Tax=Candidatus Collierbacteria bacterium GW2011_GWC2_43_12 TaxID=1618390 RepID=A0A0G1FX45_9BACT|nr:MAG: hypothetical protein UV68_C0072G0009 [Candidatus Collierbacteria bacterium GW2011_GWC2_43_12]
MMVPEGSDPTTPSVIANVLMWRSRIAWIASSKYLLAMTVGWAILGVNGNSGSL